MLPATGWASRCGNSTLKALTSSNPFLRLVRAAPLALTVLLAVVHLTPLIPWLAGSMTVWGPNPPPSAGVLIVLGAEQQADGTIGMISYWRCIYAANLFKQGRFSKLIVSGGGDPDLPAGPPLALTMSAFLQAAGVPAEAIVLEADSSSTRLNATHTARLLDGLPGPYTLVTSDIHSRRAVACFARAGVVVQSWPAPDVLKRFHTWGYRMQCGAMLAEEFGKTLYYWWKGWI